MFETWTLMQVYILVGAIFLFLAIMIWFVIWWYRKNNTVLSFDEYCDGVMLNSTLRCRIRKPHTVKRFIWFGKPKLIVGKFYGFRDFFSLSPIKHIDYEEVKNYFINTESMPVLGVKQTLNLRKVFNECAICMLPDGKETKHEHTFSYKPWYPPLDLQKEGQIDNVSIVEINQLRTELWDSTDVLTTQDLLLKIAVPIALCIVAVALMIFFPKMYNAIISNDAALMEAAKVKWQDIVTTIKPVG